MQGGKQIHALSLPEASQGLSAPCRASSSLPWALGSALAPGDVLELRRCRQGLPGAWWRNSLLFAGDAYKLLLISAVCSDSFSTSASAELVHTCFVCPHEQKH